MRIRRNLLIVIQWAPDDNLPVCVWRGGKGKTLDAIHAHTIDIPKLGFPSSMVAGGAIVVRTTHALGHALKTVLAVTLVSVNVGAWIDIHACTYSQCNPPGPIEH